MSALKAFLHPGVALMQGLGIRVRLVLVFSLLLAPILVMGVQLLVQALEQKQGVGWALFLGLGALGGVLYLFAAFYQGLTEAVDALTRVAQNNARGDLSQTVVVPGRDELSQAGRNLESMGENFSGLVGTILKEEFGLKNDVLAIDGVTLRDFDFIDLGKVLEPSGTVPVTIKSLVFQL